jgi:GNAT superfamily N-acetyltransferase
MHLLYFDAFGRNKTCHIKALWVSKEFKNCGISAKLQALGEDWARERGVQKIVTHVMTKNPRMIEMNMDYGYKPVKLELVKELA